MRSKEIMKKISIENFTLETGRKIKLLAKECLENDLNMKNYNLIIKNCKDIKHAGSIRSGRVMRININKLKTYKSNFDKLLQFLLFHELRHYYQYHTNMFTFEVTKKFGMQIDNPSLRDKAYEKKYANLPWEIDASKFALRMYNRRWKYDKIRWKHIKI